MRIYSVILLKQTRSKSNRNCLLIVKMSLFVMMALIKASSAREKAFIPFVAGSPVELIFVSSALKCAKGGFVCFEFALHMKL